MKKLISAVATMCFVAMTFAVTSAKALDGLGTFRIGAGMNEAVFYGSATETLKDTGYQTSDEALAPFDYNSVFIEYSADWAYGLTIGYEYAGDSVNLDAAQRVLASTPAGGGGDTGNQEIDAEFNNLQFTYVQLPIPMIGGGSYVRLGVAEVELVTLETLATGSTYPNKTLDGWIFGAGYHGLITEAMGGGLFYRLEANVMTFDDFKLQGSQVGGTSASYNQIAGEVGGASAKFALGYQF